MGALDTKTSRIVSFVENFVFVTTPLPMSVKSFSQEITPANTKNKAPV